MDHHYEPSDFVRVAINSSIDHFKKTNEDPNLKRIVVTRLFPNGFGSSYIDVNVHSHTPDDIRDMFTQIFKCVNVRVSLVHDKTAAIITSPPALHDFSCVLIHFDHRTTRLCHSTAIRL